MAKILGKHSSGPIGSQIAHAGSAVPPGTLLCDGSAISRTVYAALFAVIGVSYGYGDNSTTFNVPDHRGRFLRGLDGTAGRDPDKATRTASATGGNTGNNIGSVQGDGIQGHKHGTTESAHNHNINLAGSGSSPGGGNYFGADATWSAGSGPTQPSGNIVPSSTGLTVQTPTTDGSNGTPRTTSETRPANSYTNFVICYK